MTSLAVSAGPATDRRRWAVPAGGALVFGGDARVADLVIPGERTPGVVGRVTAGGDYWTIRNAAPETAVLVENASGNDFVSIPAGMEMPVPFTSSRVLVFGSTGIFGFSVRAAAHPVSDPASPRPMATGGTPLLNHDAKYFGVLVALCEPALRYGLMTELPTSGEIVQRLRRLPSYRSITSVAVDFHLHYLVTRKLSVFVNAYSSIVGAPAPVVARSRRTALVQLALRFNLVERRDLSLLDDRAGPAATPPRALRPPAHRPLRQPLG